MKDRLAGFPRLQSYLSPVGNRSAGVRQDSEMQFSKMPVWYPANNGRDAAICVVEKAGSSRSVLRNLSMNARKESHMERNEMR
eukprot:scaffold89578_cov48-Prasinocladus_malaysianus.AAC.1